MDKDHAKTIAISRILDKLNIQPEYVGKSKALYRSPFSKEREHSFWVYFKENSWYDYAIPAGGNLEDFSQRYLKFTGEGHTPVDVSRWIANLADDRFSYPQVSNDVFSSDQTSNPVLQLKSVGQIRLTGLVRYLENLGIALPLAQRYAKELKLFNRNSGRTFIALGVRNESDGYELHNPFFNGCIQPRGITFFRGATSPSHGVHVFKNIFDFLSVLTCLDCDRWEHDTILLHASSNAQLAAPYVQNYGYKTMYSWMDNDFAGQKATSTLHSFVKNQPNLVHLKMNRVYEEFSSVNAWHVATRNLQSRPG